jgi:hypothetical protein
MFRPDIAMHIVPGACRGCRVSLLAFVAASATLGCGRIGFRWEAADAADADDGGSRDAATWVRACAGSGPWTTGFDSFPAWASFWYAPTTSTAMVGVSGGALRLQPTTVNGHYAGILSPSESLRRQAISIEVDQVTNDAETFLGVEAMGGEAFVRIVFRGGQLLFHEGNAGAPHVMFELPAHRFWQLRSQDEMVFFETSADGQTFVVHHARPDPAFIETAIVSVGAGTSFDGSQDPGVAVITRLDHCLL